MIKKIILSAVIVSQLTISCDSKDSISPGTEVGIDADISAILNTPYSSLTPAEQKVKLESEANSILDEMDKLKTSNGIEAIRNLEYLMNIGNSIDILDGKNDNKITDLLSVASAYGVYTWDNTHSVWKKTASTTELKFVFPSKKTQLGTNNAVLTLNAVNSNVKVEVEDTEEHGSWQYDENSGEYVYVKTSDAILDNMYLPSSVDGVLTVDNVKAANLTANATYPDGKNIPSTSNYKIVLSDGYTWEQSGSKVQAAAFNSSLTYNGKNIINLSAGGTANIDNFIDKADVPAEYGKANYIIKVQDNFLEVANVDVQKLNDDQNNLDETIKEPDYNSASYYTDLNISNKSRSESNAAIFNNNVKMALVSKKDGTKIADVIMISEKGETYTEYTVWDEEEGYWQWDSNSNGHEVQYYNEVQYLRFNDNTLVSMETYFSSGFTSLQSNFDDFIESFNK